MKTFELDNNQVKKLDNWEKKHIKECIYKYLQSTTGERFVYEFIPTGIGTWSNVKCIYCKQSINLTDYENW